MIVIRTGILPTEKLALDSLVVRDTVHYPLMRRHIQEALGRKEDLEVFILTRVCDSWFWDLFDYHGDVIHINDTPTERLKRKLSVSALPIDLAAQPRLIVELGLLNLPDPSESVHDVWKWIIRHKLGDVWATEEPSKRHFSELVGWHIENIVDPILQPKAALIAQAWTDLASGKLRSAYARFFEDPHRSAYSLITWKALEPYDRELREEWLAAEGWYSQKLEDLAEMIDTPSELPRSIRDKLRPRVQTYWNSQLKEDFNDRRT
jgi:hypothetical protein